jgi:small conductance mechanosensitive channel
MDAIPKDSQKWFLGIGINAAKILLFLLIGFFIINRVNKIFTMFLRKTHVGQGMISFLDSVSKFTLRIILIISALDMMGVNMTSIMAALGASLVTIGLALKDSLSNIASGILLILNKPFIIGDYIKVEGTAGTVSKIEMVFTTLTTDDNKVVIIPNSKLISSSIVRQSICDLHKCRLSYKVSNLINFKDIKKQIEKFTILENRISQIPSPDICLKAISGEESIVELSFFCEKRNAEAVTQKINENIKNTLKNKNILI